MSYSELLLLSLFTVVSCPRLACTNKVYCYFVSCIFIFTSIHLSIYFVLTALLQGHRIILSKLSELIKSCNAFRTFLVSKGS